MPDQPSSAKSRRARPGPASTAAPTRARATRKSRSAKETSARPLPSADRHHLISEAAYFRAEARGFCPGDMLDDWLAAEREIDAMLLQQPVTTRRSAEP